MPKIEKVQVRAKLEKQFLIRRTVVLHDVQEFVVRGVADECQAQDAAEAHIASYSKSSPARVENVEQRRCEIVDVGMNATWSFEELRN